MAILIDNSRKIKSIHPDLLISQPTYGYPQVVIGYPQVAIPFLQVVISYCEVIIGYSFVGSNWSSSDSYL